jgi:hypothetical protein
MATADLDILLDKVRHLPPDKLRQVEALVQHLQSEEPERKSRFRNVAGTLGDDDARAMRNAVQDCERIDPRGW